jgi:hypothetical protein
MAVRLSALGAGRLLIPERFLELIPVRAWGDLRAIMRLEKLSKFISPIISSNIG